MILAAATLLLKLGELVYEFLTLRKVRRHYRRKRAEKLK